MFIFSLNLNSLFPFFYTRGRSNHTHHYITYSFATDDQSIQQKYVTIHLLFHTLSIDNSLTSLMLPVAVIERGYHLLSAHSLYELSIVIPLWVGGAIMTSYYIIRGLTFNQFSTLVWYIRPLPHTVSHTYQHCTYLPTLYLSL